MGDDRKKSYIEIVGVGAVVVSLVFVAFEIRQNTNALRSASIQSIADMAFEATMGLSDNADLRQAYLLSNSQDITDDQKLALDAWLNGLMRIQEMRYINFELGTISREDLGTVGARNRVYSNPYVQQYWTERKSEYSAGFQEYMSREVFPDLAESNE